MGGIMAISIVSSREIFWDALNKALGLTYSPGDLKDFFETTDYKDLFSGWVEDQLEMADEKVTKLILETYQNNNAVVNRTKEDIKEKSKQTREAMNDPDDKIVSFFIWVHSEVYESV